MTRSHFPSTIAGGPEPRLGAGGPLGRAEPVRRRTLVALRWVALAGQASAVLAAWLLGAQLPFLPVLAVILAAAAANLALGARQGRVSPREALAQLVLDTVQTGTLLTLTGGTGNPFALFVLAPLTIGASVLPRRQLYVLGTATALTVLAMTLLPVPLVFAEASARTAGTAMDVAAVLALAIGGLFLALSTHRVSSELSATENALQATRMGLAREQRLQHLGGVVAAAAHEMGTPLATIKLVAGELADDLSGREGIGPDVGADLALLQSSADRCRDILRSMGSAGKDDLHLHSAPLSDLLEEAARPHVNRGAEICIDDTTGAIVRRDPAVIHALRNLVQNAVDFAATRVNVTAAREAGRITVTIRDDGPGYPPHLLGRLGEPYLTTRRQGTEGPDGYEGMGLGLFIGRTLLERSGGRVSFANDNGAVARVTWPEAALLADDRAVLRPNPAISD